MLLKGSFVNPKARRERREAAVARRLPARRGRAVLDRSIWVGTPIDLASHPARPARRAARDLGSAPEGLTTWHRRRIHVLRNLLAQVGPGQRALVAAASRTVFTQEAARGQWRQVADGLRARFARLARAMDEAKDDVLAYMTFHPDHWTRISSTDEIKRRTDVAGHLTDRGRDRPPGRRCCSKQNSLETLAAFGHSDQLRLSAVAA
jgi:hypothetical protein